MAASKKSRRFRCWKSRCTFRSLHVRFSLHKDTRSLRNTMEISTPPALGQNNQQVQQIDEDAIRNIQGERWEYLARRGLCVLPLRRCARRWQLGNRRRREEDVLRKRVVRENLGRSRAVEESRGLCDDSLSVGGRLGRGERERTQ